VAKFNDGVAARQAGAKGLTTRKIFRPESNFCRGATTCIAAGEKDVRAAKRQFTREASVYRACITHRGIMRSPRGVDRRRARRRRQAHRDVRKQARQWDNSVLRDEVVQSVRVE